MKYSIHSWVAFLLLCSFTIGGCATTQKAPDAVTLQVEYRWTAAHKCSSTSPEIRLTGVPPATKQLRVTLTDLDVPSYNHGGGRVKYEGSNIIPAGALKSYVGPCPPSGTHKYSIKVDALDASGIILGTGSKTLPCCP